MKKGAREIPWASSSWLVFVSWKTSAPEITGKEWESYPAGSRSSRRKNGKAEEWKDIERKEKKNTNVHNKAWAWASEQAFNKKGKSRKLNKWKVESV